MDLVAHNWSLTLDLNGGRICQLSYKNRRIFGTYNRIDGKQGNTHLCVPSFDKEGQEKYNLPFHGLVRNIVWNEELRTKNKLTITTVTEPTVLYTARLKVSQTFQLDDSFTHSITIVHLDGESVPVNCAIHYYWDTPMGWNTIQINNANIKTNIETNGFIKLQQKNNIQFPHASFELISNGFQNATMWTSFKSGEKGERKYSKDFCCIEPVVSWPGYFGSEESILTPGKSFSASITLLKVV